MAAIALFGCTSVRMVERNGCWLKQTDGLFRGLHEELGVDGDAGAELGLEMDRQHGMPREPRGRAQGLVEHGQDHAAVALAGLLLRRPAKTAPVPAGCQSSG